MRLLHRLLFALVALVAGIGQAHGQAYGMERPTAAPLALSIDWFEGFTGHTDDGTCAAAHSRVAAPLRLGGVAQAGAALGVFALATYVTHRFGIEAGALVLANAPAVLPEEVTKSLGELKANIKRVLELEEQIKKGAEAEKGVAELKGEVKKLTDANAKLIDKVDEAVKKLNERQDEFETEAMKRLGAGGAGEVKTLGERFVESEAFKAALEDGSVKAGRMPWVDAGPVHGNQKRIAIKAVTLTGITTPDYVGEVIRPRDQRLAMRDLIPGGTTSKDRVSFIRVTSRATGAAITGQGQTKPESGIVMDRVQADVEKIAHWIVVDDEQLDDVEGLRSLIDAEMEYGLRVAEDQEILYGDGTAAPNGGNHLDGIVEQATAYDDALEATIQAAAGITTVTLLDRIRIAMAQLASADFAGDGLVLNPVDMAVLMLTQTEDGAYKFANPTSGETPRPWGLRTVETTRFDQGDLLVGQFSIGAQIFDKMRPMLKVGYVNDQLIKNQLTIVAEERLALMVKYPSAFIYRTSEASS